MSEDSIILEAGARVREALSDPAKRPEIASFFDEASNTVSYLVWDRASKAAAVIDPVLGYDPASGRTDTAMADALAAQAEAEGLSVEWLIETHAHADHLSAGPYLQQRLGGQIAIGSEISHVQGVFGEIFHEGEGLARDGSQFDHLFEDGETFTLGALQATALYVPGHTPADMALVIGDAAFVGDTLFMPDYGTARADFPGGDARQLFRSIRRLLSLPEETRLFMCHDYKAPGREEFAWETTVQAQRTSNVHAREGISEDDFVAMREARDATLAMPTLILPSIQVNIRAGHLPEPEENGVSYLKIPVNAL